MFATVEKCTLLTFCRKAHITSEQLAREAGLPVYQTYTVEIGGYYQERIVKQVVEAYNKLSQQQHTIYGAYTHVLSDVGWNLSQKRWLDPLSL